MRRRKYRYFCSNVGRRSKVNKIIIKYSNNVHYTYLKNLLMYSTRTFATSHICKCAILIMFSAALNLALYLAV